MKTPTDFEKYVLERSELSQKTLKIGDIIVSTWGYDARLATFSRVIKRTAKSLVIAEMLDQKHTGDWTDGTAAPILTSRLGPETRRKICTWGGGDECVHDGNAFASKWDLKPVRTYNHH